ncbi:MAG: hypothetical protein IJR04_10390 [Bacteroidales bacterium]|nr:hypothetical protein [Bacteroidales bacterium]
MARKQGDSESGKLGNKIYYTRHGRQCERSMPTSVANPQTEAQQAHRSNFAMISKLSSYMKAAHLVGLHWHAIREHNSTYAIFRQLNKDCFTPDGEINLPSVIVSRGSVESVVITSATINNGALTVTFDTRVYGGKATDEFFLFVYCPALCTGRLATPVPRSSGLVTAVLPPEWLHPAEPTQTFPQSDNQFLHLYAFLRSTRSRTSDTIHLSLPVNPS